MQGIVTAAWAKRLLLVVACRLWEKVETRLDVMFCTSKFPLFYGFDILFVLFELLLSCLDSKFLLAFSWHLTFFFILFTCLSISSLFLFLILVLIFVFNFLCFFFLVSQLSLSVSQLTLLFPCYPLLCWKLKESQWIHSSRTANVFFFGSEISFALICGFTHMFSHLFTWATFLSLPTYHEGDGSKEMFPMLIFIV